MSCLSAEAVRGPLARAAEALALAGGVGLLAVTAVTSWNAGAFAADRLLPGDVAGLPGYEDFVGLVTGASVLLFFPYCQLVRGHVAVELFVGALPARVTAGLDRLWLGVTAVAAAFLAVWLGSGARETRADNTLSPILGWPEWPFLIPGVVALALWALIAAEQCRRAGRAPSNGS
ncbi:MAG: TRAP transporter small permease [Paracoccaceae bacterium]